MTTNEKIAALRAAAKAAGADGVLIMTSDPHCSEYLPGYYNALPWFSGFIGENSTLVVTQDRSALWCDGRFYVQADKQLAGSEIECMHAGSAGVPTVAEYLGSHFADGQTLLLDGSCVPATLAEEYAAALAKTLGQVWQRHPAQGLYAITADADFEQHFGKKAARRRKIYNGMIPCQLYMYFEQPKREKR